MGDFQKQVSWPIRTHSDAVIGNPPLIQNDRFIFEFTLCSFSDVVRLLR